MIYVAVLTGLRVSELLALKWRNIHKDSITVEHRYSRGDWSKTKTRTSAATIAADAALIGRITSSINWLLQHADDHCECG